MQRVTEKCGVSMRLAIGLAVVALMAVMGGLTILPGNTSAQTHDDPAGAPIPTSPSSATDAVESSSTTSGVAVKLTLTIGNPGMLVSGSSIELYLEDDFQVPDSIHPSDVYFIGSGIGRVYVTDPIEIYDDDFFGGDDDWSILVSVPDRNPANDTGFDAWSADDAAGVQLVFTEAAGIRNPTEAGTHSVGYSVLGPGAPSNDGPQVVLTNVDTYAKIALSRDSGRRGRIVTITGTGFNNGTSAEAYVYGPDQGYNGSETPTCEEVVTAGDSLGSAEVGSDDRFSFSFIVHQDEFTAGAVNWICAVDSEAGNPRFAKSPKLFELLPSISIAPRTVAPGDAVTITALDFPQLDADAILINIEGLIDVPVESIDGTRVTFRLPDEVPTRWLGCPIRIAFRSGTTTLRAVITVADPTKAPTELGRPCNLNAAPGAQAGTVDLRWNPPVGAQYHFVVFIPAGIFDPNLAVVMPVPAEGRATITGLHPETPYQFIVIAGRWEWTPVYGAKWSPWSHWATATPGP